jgi:hypothetical protein
VNVAVEPIARELHAPLTGALALPDVRNTALDPR